MPDGSPTRSPAGTTTDPTSGDASPGVVAPSFPYDTTTPPADGDTLVFDEASETWVPGAAGGGGSSGLPALTANVQTASYTLVLSDAGKVVEMDSADPNTLTVPPNADVAFAIGTQIEVVQVGAGLTTITGGVGVTVESAYAPGEFAGQYKSAILRKRATNTWVAVGGAF